MSQGDLLAERYQLVEQLGSGGMGSVWRARDLKLKAEVAIKLMDAAIANSPDALARFRREAEAAAAIRSTHVVQILDYGVDASTPFIAMELLKGESLADRLARQGRLDPAQTATILGHVGRALALAHEQHIVHRDLKPENVFLASEGDEDVAKVLDFGIASRRDGLGNGGGIKTRTGVLLGTPCYMSPEQAKAQPVDYRSDIWSFGAIAFECLAGRRPFESESLAQLFHFICIAELPVPSQLGEVPPGFDAWFARAAAREPSERFPTVGQAADELRALCGRRSGSFTTSDNPGTLAQATVASRADPGRELETSGTSDGLGHSVPPVSHTKPVLEQRTRRMTLGAAVLVAAALVVGFALYHRAGAPEPMPLPSSAAANLASHATSLQAVSARPVIPRPVPRATPFAELAEIRDAPTGPSLTRSVRSPKPRALGPGASAVPEERSSPGRHPAVRRRGDDNAAGI